MTSKTPLKGREKVRIRLDQIDYREFSGDVIFYEKSSRDVIIT